jgi:hypothetical protein
MILHDRKVSSIKALSAYCVCGRGVLCWCNMHPIQEKLLGLSKKENLAKLSLREMAAGIGLPKESPQ